MPEMDGFEFVENLRKHPGWRQIPVIVITSKEVTEADHRRLNGQVERIIQKGALSFEELLDEVRSITTKQPTRNLD